MMRAYSIRVIRLIRFFTICIFSNMRIIASAPAFLMASRNNHILSPLTFCSLWFAGMQEQGSAHRRGSAQVSAGCERVSWTRAISGLSSAFDRLLVRAQRIDLIRLQRIARAHRYARSRVARPSPHLAHDNHLNGTLTYSNALYMHCAATVFLPYVCEAVAGPLVAWRYGPIGFRILFKLACAVQCTVYTELFERRIVILFYLINNFILIEDLVCSGCIVFTVIFAVMKNVYCLFGNIIIQIFNRWNN